jgi:hypothetical protein
MAASGRQATDHDQYRLQWYSRREGVVRGPFSAEQITRYLLLGRIRPDDELSADKSAWSPANIFSDMLPPEVTSLTSRDDYQKLVIARMLADERQSERRCQHCPNRDQCRPDRRRGGDRRREKDNVLARQYLYNHADRQSTRRPLLLTLLLATLMFAWLYPTQR